MKNKFYTKLFNEQYRGIKSPLKENFKYNLNIDILGCSYLRKICKQRFDFAQHLYAALCDNKFIKFKKNRLDLFIKEVPWNCSWKQSAFIVSYISKKNVMDFYYSGLKIWREDIFVEEGTITKEIKEFLKNLGWEKYV